MAPTCYTPVVLRSLQINTAIDKHGLNVQFILDGDGVPQKCLVDKWQPWIATYISLDDPSVRVSKPCHAGVTAAATRRGWQALTSAGVLRFGQGAFTSNNMSLGYNRFAVLNEPTYLFPFAAASK